MYIHVSGAACPARWGRGPFESPARALPSFLFWAASLVPGGKLGLSSFARPLVYILVCGGAGLVRWGGGPCGPPALALPPFLFGGAGLVPMSGGCPSIFARARECIPYRYSVYFWFCWGACLVRWGRGSYVSHARALASVPYFGWVNYSQGSKEGGLPGGQGTVGPMRPETRPGDLTGRRPRSGPPIATSPPALTPIVPSFFFGCARSSVVDLA